MLPGGVRPLPVCGGRIDPPRPLLPPPLGAAPGLCPAQVAAGVLRPGDGERSEAAGHVRAQREAAKVPGGGRGNNDLDKAQMIGRKWKRGFSVQFFEVLLRRDENVC